MIKLLNKMGLFIKWEYYGSVSGSNIYRYSKALNKWQYEYVECRGHGASDYKSTWHNIPLARKPKIRQIEGVWCVSVIEEIQKGTAYPPSYNKPITMKKEQA